MVFSGNPRLGNAITIGDLDVIRDAIYDLKGLVTGDWSGNEGIEAIRHKLEQQFFPGESLD